MTSRVTGAQQTLLPPCYRPGAMLEAVTVPAGLSVVASPGLTRSLLSSATSVPVSFDDRARLAGVER